MLSPQLNEDVRRLVANLGVVLADRELFGRNVWSAFSQGKPPGQIDVLVAAGEKSSDGLTLIQRVEEYARLALELRGLISECRREQLQGAQ